MGESGLEDVVSYCMERGTAYKRNLTKNTLYMSEVWSLKEIENGFLQTSERSMVRAMC